MPSGKIGVIPLVPANELWVEVHGGSMKHEWKINFGVESHWDVGVICHCHTT